MTIKERFGSFNRRGLFSRIDTDHPLELLIGLDDRGNKSIKLRAQFNPRKLTGTEGLDVKQFKNDSYSTIAFSLINDEMSSLFYLFCEDIIESTRKIEDISAGYQFITMRFLSWKKMFGGKKQKLLTEPEIMGLIGELLLLSTKLFDKYGKEKALQGWSGQELTHKDFSYENTWYESKAILKSSTSVRISSIEQLESNSDGELVVTRLEKMSPSFNGVSLNSLVREIYNMFDVEQDRDSFIKKVQIQGFSFNDYYDQFVYAVCEQKFYLVNSSFPKIQREQLADAIIRAQYDIDIRAITDFEKK